MEIELYNSTYFPFINGETVTYPRDRIPLPRNSLICIIGVVSGSRRYHPCHRFGKDGKTYGTNQAKTVKKQLKFKKTNEAGPVKTMKKQKTNRS